MNDEAIADLKQFITTTVEEQVGGLRTDITGLKEDMAGVKADISGLKQDVAGLKQDVGSLKQDVAGLKEDVADLQQGQVVLTQDVAGLKSELSDVKVDVAVMKQTMVTKDDLKRSLKATEDRLIRRMDGGFKGSRHAVDVIHAELADDNRRLTKLEHAPFQP